MQDGKNDGKKEGKLLPKLLTHHQDVEGE